jgi:hypothetical protein
MHELAADLDPFVAIHAAVYEIKALVALERMLEAGARLADLAAGPHKVDAYSYFQAEVDFLRAYSMLGDLRYEEAETALKRFLLNHADASARLTIAARQMLMELANRDPEKLGDVVDLMDFSGKRLKSEDAGETVRTRQQRILDLLDKLIKEEEEKEKQNSSSSGGGSSSGTPNNSPSNPMQQSQLPGGAPRPVSPARPPRQSWRSLGVMPRPNASAASCARAARSHPLPSYVEQYYEELSKKP